MESPRRDGKRRRRSPLTLFVSLSHLSEFCVHRSRSLCSDLFVTFDYRISTRYLVPSLPHFQWIPAYHHRSLITRVFPLLMWTNIPEFFIALSFICS